ncbi:hypothetical protein [Bacillus sp. SG-1]|uniref:hypothetical protein n=1 Tax=Bacillus sp. SG-1 TaxID=161544 RepID=UPI0001544551|nr:hypothetical protein [Bacillus sp. SG-1]EDL64333.1 hypothetical protein BSG1_14483 [Bacillus sp. SG-1]
MKAAKRILVSIIGGGLAAGLLGDCIVSAEKNERETVIEAENNTVSPSYVPADGGGHTWTYVKTTYISSGYIKLYSDSDSYWYYTKEIYYDTNGKYIKTFYDKFAR